MITPAEVMQRVREAYLNSSLTYREIGLRMGYGPDPHMAKVMAYQFVMHTRRPQATTLRRFAYAVKIPVSHLLKPSVRRPVQRFTS